jgi:hypothetical protein
MEEKRVIGVCVLDQPVHGSKDVLLGWLAHCILLVVCQDDHILARIAKVLVQVCAHVFDIVDTSSKLAAL